MRFGLGERDRLAVVNAEYKQSFSLAEGHTGCCECVSAWERDILAVVNVFQPGRGKDLIAVVNTRWSLCTEFQTGTRCSCTSIWLAEMVKSKCLMISC